MYNLLKKRKGLNSSQIYLSISKADKKSKVSKKSKNVYSDTCHNFLHNK